MIPILVAVLMQAGGAYTHLPKVTLFPKPALAAQAPLTSGQNFTTTEPASVKLAGAGDRCSVRMPQMAIPKDVEFHIDTIKPAVIVEPSVVVPAPECPAPKSER
jgi:hypothetical protein